jgi:hypothetical protein
MSNIVVPRHPDHRFRSGSGFIIGLSARNQ